MVEGRPPLEIIALAAWLNVAPEQLPDTMRAKSCDATMQAWKRVADAIYANSASERSGARVDREAVVTLILQHIGYKPHPWDNAREGSFTGAGAAADAIMALIAQPEQIAESANSSAVPIGVIILDVPSHNG